MVLPVSIASSKIKKHGKSMESMESMEYHHGYKIENHGFTMVSLACSKIKSMESISPTKGKPWYHSKSTNQKFSFHNIYRISSNKRPPSFKRHPLIRAHLILKCWK